MYEGRLQELEKQNELLRKEHAEFLKIITHDFSAPLRHIAQFSSLLEENLNGQMDEEGSMYLSCVMNSSERARAMLDGLLVLSRLSLADPIRHECDCSSIIDEVFKTIRDEFSDKKIDVTYSELPLVQGDEQMLFTLFYNIIKNATVFCEPAICPCITIKAKASDGFWEFKLSDNGIGVDTRHESIVFAAFRKLHADADYPGLGLGLTLCEKIVKLHGGEISLQAGVAGGTDVIFTLPIRSTS